MPIGGFPYADRPDVLQRQLSVLADHCHSVGRDPAHDPARDALDRRTSTATGAAARRWAGAAVEAPQPAFAGDPAELRDRLTALAALGFDLVQLRFAGLFGHATSSCSRTRYCHISVERANLRWRTRERALAR